LFVGDETPWKATILKIENEMEILLRWEIVVRMIVGWKCFSITSSRDFDSSGIEPSDSTTRE
jgi:hypothetical protein